MVQGAGTIQGQDIFQSAQAWSTIDDQCGNNSRAGTIIQANTVNVWPIAAMLLLYPTYSHLEMHLQYGRGGSPNISKRSAYFSNIWTGGSKYFGGPYITWQAHSCFNHNGMILIRGAGEEPTNYTPLPVCINPANTTTSWPLLTCCITTGCVTTAVTFAVCWWAALGKEAGCGW